MMKFARKAAARLSLGLLILWGMLLYYPVRTGFCRASLLITFTGILLCLTALLWRRRLLRWLPLALPVAAALILLLPGRPADPIALRAAYTTSLTSYSGTRYVWGGENWRGVDCSGLLRSALVDAHLKQALRTFNPALARQGLWFWWHDASAREMGDGYQGMTQPLAAPTPLRDLSPALLQPGDLAVTADGSHVLAYLGNNSWIEADPYVLQVIQLPPRFLLVEYESHPLPLDLPHPPLTPQFPHGSWANRNLAALFSVISRLSAADN